MSPPLPYRPPVGGSYLGLLRKNRDFRLLFIATLISLAGDWFLTVALLDQVLVLTGKATYAALVTLAMNLPVFLATPWAGAVADKFDRRRLMIGVDLVRAGAALLPLLATTPETLPLSYLGVCLLSIGSAVADPAADAALPNLVAPEDLARGNVLLGSAWGTMMTLGAAAGGLVTVYFGREASFVVDSLSFAVSALLLCFVRVPFSERAAQSAARPEGAPPPSKPPVPPRWFDSARETWTYARKNRRVLALLLGKAGFGLSGAVISMLSVFGRDIFHGGAESISQLLVARGIGALLGPFVLVWLLGSGLRQQRAIVWYEMLFGLGYVVLCLSPALPLSPGARAAAGLIGVCIAHSGAATGWQAAMYGLQRETPDSLRGRVFAADYGIYTLVASIASVCAGLLSDRYGVVPTALGFAILCALWPIAWGLWSRNTFRDPTDPEPPPAP